MPHRDLPVRPRPASLEQEAEELLAGLRGGEPAALDLLVEFGETVIVVEAKTPARAGGIGMELVPSVEPNECEPHADHPPRSLARHRIAAGRAPGVPPRP